MTERISVLLADDHALLRRGVRRLLDDDATITVVGEAIDGEDAVRLAHSLRPRVVAMDCAMPRMDGIVATRRILEKRPDIAVLFLSIHSEAHVVRQAIAAGARGYVLKDSTDLDLADAIRRVAAGDMVLDPHVWSPTAARARSRGLSPRRLEVLQLICNGMSNEAIAATLGLSINTVGVHRASIMRTLGVHSAGQLVSFAIRHRLVKMP